MPAELQLLRPLWLLALIPLLGLLALLVRRRAQDRVWWSLIDPHLLPHLLDAAGGRIRWPLGLLALGWLLAVLALAGPVWQRVPVPVFAVDAKRVILLDVSPSMNAADVPPSRLARARFEVLDLLAASREGQVALVAYGPEPFVVSPLTGDAKTIADQMPQLASDLIPVPGPRRTDLALQLAGDLLAAAGAGPGQVILITDGVVGDPSEGAADQARALDSARALAEAGHRLSVLAVGTAEGAPVPAAPKGFAGGEGGAIALSRLDAQGLEALARAGGGRSVSLAAGDEDTRALIAGAPSGRSDVLAQEGLTADQWREEGPWLLLVLLPLAALAFRRGWLLPALVCVALLPPTPGWALDWGSLWQRPDQRGAQAFAAGDAEAAAGTFRDPAWRAAARYRAGDFDGALEDLTGLAGAQVDYNRGNALARLGRLDDAIAAYERALEQDPQLEDARANLELLRRLKEAQAPPPESQSEDQQGKDAQSFSQGASQGQQSQRSDQAKDQAGDGRGEPPEDGGQAGRQDAESQGSGEGGGQANDGSSGQAGTPEAAAASDASGAADGPGAEPSAADLRSEAAEREAQTGPVPEPPGPAENEEGSRPGEVPGSDRAPDAPAAGAGDLTPEERERQQALEAQLRRVPDDPAGLLRQRFILQHLRRQGRLP